MERTRGGLGPGDVGHRVVVRRYVGVGPTGRPLFTDLLGELLAFDEHRLLVRAEDGSEHTIAGRDVTAAKRVGPRPARYSEIVALERAADEAWPAPVHERLGDWFLRAAQGWTSRANSALPLGDPGRPLTDAIDACEAWYRGRGLTPRVSVPLPLRRDVAEALSVRNWHAQPPVLVQTAPLTSAPSIPSANPPSMEPGPHLLPAPSREFLALVGARKAGLPPAALEVLAGPPMVRFAEIRGSGGALLAGARGAVVGDGSWLHVSLVEVVADARRRGLARRISLALMEWAGGLGATRAVLQVEEHNAAAVALYRGLGFANHHRYVTYAGRP